MFLYWEIVWDKIKYLLGTFYQWAVNTVFVLEGVVVSSVFKLWPGEPSIYLITLFLKHSYRALPRVEMLLFLHLILTTIQRSSHWGMCCSFSFYWTQWDGWGAGAWLTVYVPTISAIGLREVTFVSSWLLFIMEVTFEPPLPHNNRPTEMMNVSFLTLQLTPGTGVLYYWLIQTNNKKMAR